MADLLCTIMVLCQGRRENGKPFWAYLCIRPSMAKAFKEAREKGAFNLEEFGTVIESGDGTDIPADIRRRMETEFGVNHDYEKQLLKTIDAVDRKMG